MLANFRRSYSLLRIWLTFAFIASFILGGILAIQARDHATGDVAGIISDTPGALR